MSSQEEESRDLNPPGYQFFSPDLNYSYFDQSDAVTGVPVSDAASLTGLVASVTPVAPVAPAVPVTLVNPAVPFALVAPAVPVALVAPAVPVAPAFSDSVSAASTPSTASTPSAASTPSTAWTTQTVSTPNRAAESKTAAVPYSIMENEPEPTFEERVAAMEREIAEADAASARARALAAQAPAPSVGQEPGTIDLSSAQAFGHAFALTTNFQAPGLAPAVEETPLSYTGTANVAAPDEERWNKYPEPDCDSTRFSDAFNFNRSLLKIFWRIDVDHNNRVSKNELAIALDNNWFEGDERLLAMLLYESYEDISPEAIFCDAGLSVNNILSFAPFAPMAAEKLESQAPTLNQSARNSNLAKGGSKKSKSSQSLRSMFKR
ncbi:MAG TPA: hypothetical protein V6C89_03225 [Drouetiella sp.]|jgi:hypothetical protein